MATSTCTAGARRRYFLLPVFFFLCLSAGADPAVTSTVPRNAAHSVLLDGNITAQFNTNVMASTITGNTFLLHSGQSGYRHGSISFNAETNATTLDPDTDFRPGELIFAELTRGITNATGDAELKPHIWSFRAAVEAGQGRLYDSGQRLNCGRSGGVALGDLDGDGDLDVFAANRDFWFDTVWINDGVGTFSDSGQKLGSSYGWDVKLADVDGDGDLDAVVSNTSGANDLWINNGSGIFSNSGQTFGGVASWGVALGDVDADGDIDAFWGGQGASNSLWLNDGSGVFYDGGLDLGRDGRAVEFADLDGDGDLDAFVANYAGSQVWLNNGSGVFSSNGQSLSTGQSHGIALGDLNSDGYIDIFVANINQPNTVWTNDGSGAFSDSGQGLGNGTSTGVTLGDLDGDGDLDAYVANAYQANTLWLNDGDGVFSDSQQRFGLAFRSSDSGIGDLDGDGSLDVFVANDWVNSTVWFNLWPLSPEAGANVTEVIPANASIAVSRNANVSAHFNKPLMGSTATTNTFLLHGEKSGYLHGNISVDATTNTTVFDPDDGFRPGERILATVTRGMSNAIGDAQISPYTWEFHAPVEGGSGYLLAGQTLGAGESRDVALGDLDGDGDLDAFVANDHDRDWYDYCRIWLNDGAGTFVDNGAVDGKRARRVVLGDLDRDGDLDAVILPQDDLVQVFKNNGAGVFTRHTYFGSARGALSAGLGDMDGDGDLDLFTIHVGGDQHLIWLNDGFANFSLFAQNLQSADARDVQLGDLDGDGDLDAFVVHMAANHVWLNNGAAVFTNTWQNLGSESSQDVALGDLDGDGDLDAFVANFGVNKVWLNTSPCVFSPSAQPFGPENSIDVELGDADGDGDLDAWVVNQSGTNMLWMNDGSGFFSEGRRFVGRSAGYGADLGDLDGDGDLDAFVARTADSIGNELNEIWMNASPTITVLGTNDVQLINGETTSALKGTDFGIVPVEGTRTHTFVIENGMEHVLAINSWAINGTGAADFTVVGPSIVEKGAARNFTIEFHPSVEMVRTAAVVIVNSSTNSPYYINVRGEGHGVLPFVTNTMPANAAMAASRSTEIVAQFNTAVASFASSHFVLHSEQDGYLNGALSLHSMSNGVTFMPTVNFRAGARMLAGLTRGITNMAGNAELIPYAWSFRTPVDRGSGIFTNTQNLGGSYSSDPALGDLDGDGDLDLFVVNHGQSCKVWMNDPPGTFTDSGQALSHGAGTTVGLGDMDRDGDLDAFVADNTGASKLWTNNGTGTFTDSGQSLFAANATGSCVADVDGDGDLDFIVAVHGGANKVWLNNGDGTFVDSGASLGSRNSRDVIPGDLDGDGDIDLFVPNVGQGNTVWLNNGDGVFLDSGQSMGSSESYGAALGDVDGDGDLDAFVANYGQANKVWLNDGNGTFTDSGQNMGAGANLDVDLGDFDADGDLDAYVSTFQGANEVWLNDGNGTFVDSGQLLGSGNSQRLALGDVDGDGDIDAIVANSLSYQPNELWLNVSTYTISATAEPHGSLSPTGDVVVMEGGQTNFLVEADTYYHIDELLTNSAEDTAAANMAIYTSAWQNVMADGTVTVSFAENLAALGTPHWWLALHGLTNSGMTFDEAETNDTDIDLVPAWREWGADTVPTNRASCFLITAISNNSPVTVWFDSSSNRVYTLYSESNLIDTTWSNGPNQGPRRGVGGLDHMTDTNAPQRRFYRLGVQLP